MVGQRGAGRIGGRWRWRQGREGGGREEHRERAVRVGTKTEKEKKRQERGWMDRTQRDGRLEWAPGLGVPAWAWAWGGVGTGSAPCTCRGGWVWAHKMTEVRPSGKSASVPAPSSPHPGHALAYHLALRANALHAPSKCTEMSPSAPASLAPASPTPPPQETKKVSLNLSHLPEP